MSASRASIGSKCTRVALRRRLSLTADSAVDAGEALDRDDFAALRRAIRALSRNHTAVRRLMKLRESAT